MKRRTKIVATLGPSVDSFEGIKTLVDCGVNVFRINCSHGDWDTRKRWIEWVRACSPDVAPVGIMVDLSGPKFRLASIDDGSLELVTGASIRIGSGQGDTLPVTQPEVLTAFAQGAKVLLGDGMVELKLGAGRNGSFDAKVVAGGVVKSRQGITVVGRTIDAAPLTDKDLVDLATAADLGVDMIALSYVRSAADMMELRRYVGKHDPSIRLCAKIETREALKSIDEILKVSDIVMVARGDLGLQMDIEEVPPAQKRILARASVAGVPVITATQMLESMMESARPTRAEASDVANAIWDGTDAVMLSGETAGGKYPFESVRTMAKIAAEAEPMFDHAARLHRLRDSFNGEDSSTEAVALAATMLAQDVHAKAIVTTTTSGQTARLVSKFRPTMPILCASWDRRTLAQSAVVWGVEAICLELPTTIDETLDSALNAFVRLKRLKVGDRVVMTAGIPPGMAGRTNLIHVKVVE